MEIHTHTHTLCVHGLEESKLLRFQFSSNLSVGSFNTILIKSQWKFYFVKIDNLTLKFTWKHKGVKITKTTLKNKNRIGELTPLHRKPYYRATVTK